MQITEFVVAANGERGQGGLFLCYFGAGLRPGAEGARGAIRNALRAAGVAVEEGFVVFDDSYPKFPALKTAARLPAIALNGVSGDVDAFALDLRHHPDFIPR